MKTLMQNFRVSDSYLKQEEKGYIVNTSRAQGIRKWKIIHIETWSISNFFFFLFFFFFSFCKTARQTSSSLGLFLHLLRKKQLFSCTFSRTDPRIRCLFFFFLSFSFMVRMTICSLFRNFLFSFLFFSSVTISATFYLGYLHGEITLDTRIIACFSRVSTDNLSYVVIRLF